MAETRRGGTEEAVVEQEESSNPKDPKTREEWQEAVDAMQACLTFDAARRQGAIRNKGPLIDTERCKEIIKRGRRIGIVPRREAVEKLLTLMARS